MQIQILTDPLRAIRRVPENYFPVPSTMGETMASKLAYQAMILGSSDVSIVRCADWWILASSSDWVAAKSLSAPVVFSTIVPCLEDGPNSHHYEIVVTAFAESYISIGRDGETISQGNIESVLAEVEEIRQRIPSGRVLAFRLR